MGEINKAFSEVYDIINHLEEKLYNRIPKKFIKMIEENKDNTYNPHINYNISINNQKLLKETRIILSLIYRSYICLPDEKQNVGQDDNIEQNKSNMGFNYETIFKDKSKGTQSIQNSEIIACKENIFRKIVNFIKNHLRY